MRTTTLIRITTPDSPNPREEIISAIQKLPVLMLGHQDVYPISISHVEGDRPDYVVDSITVDRTEYDLIPGRDYSVRSQWKRWDLHRQKVLEAERVIYAGIGDSNRCYSQVSRVHTRVRTR